VIDEFSGGENIMKFTKISLIALIHIVWGLRAACAADSDFELKPIPLPGASGAAGLDYFAYDAGTGKVWVPASNLASVDVIDEKTDAVAQVTGFKTVEVERRGQKRTVGPTAATIGDGVVYIGNRGDATICAIDSKTLKRGECVPLSTDHSLMPDGVIYVAATKEVWITTRPTSEDNINAAKSLQIFDASEPSRLKWKAKIPLENLAEGYAVDNGRGLFYTNVEEVGNTLAIDVRVKRIVSKWNPGSTEVGGLALDAARGFLFVACGDHIVNLDAGHDGQVLDSIQTGAGLDNIDYSAEKKLLYAAAGQATTLTIAEVGDNGKFHLKATVPTAKGARSVAAGKGETAYLIDPVEGRILKLTHK